MTRAAWMPGLLAVALLAPAEGRATDGTGWGGRPEVGPADLRAFEAASRHLRDGIGQAGVRPRKTVRQWRLAFASPRAGLFPWDDYYAQRGTAFSGEVSVDPATSLIRATVRVDGRVLGDGHENLYFLTFLPVTAVTDPGGDPVSFEETWSSGVKLTRIPLAEPPADQTPFSYVFTLEGTPDCEFASAFTVNLCAFGDITYLAMDVVLPGSLMGDFATLDLQVTVPEGLVVTSSGVTVSVVPSPTPGLEVHHVVQDFPTDSHSLVVAPFQASSIPYGDKWVGTYTMAGTLVGQVVPKVLSDMRDILTFYSDRYGEFLFPKMEASQVTDDAGAAFGWPALLWVPEAMFLMGAGGGGGGHWGEEQRTALFAHELGHQWFPDLIKNNDAWGAWLSEGFAEFSSVYFMSSLSDESYLQGTFESYGMMYRYFVPAYLDYGLTSQESQYVSDGMTYQIVTYYKGAVVVNMIRKVLGDQKFLQALRNLYADLAGKEAWYDTAILQTYFEEAYGDSLSWLFDAWVYGKGYPIYTVDVTRVSPGEDGKNRVRVRVRRSSNIPGQAFSGPTGFLVVTDQGEEPHTEWVDQDDLTFEWPHDGRLVKVRFDPERVFIKRVDPGLDGDMDLSGEVDGVDLLYTAWAQNGQIGQSFNFLPYVDFDANGVVDPADLDRVLTNFGRTSGEVVP